MRQQRWYNSAPGAAAPASELRLGQAPGQRLAPLFVCTITAQTTVSPNTKRVPTGLPRRMKCP